MRTRNDGRLWVKALLERKYGQPDRNVIEVAVQQNDDDFRPARVTLTVSQAHKLVAQVEQEITKAKANEGEG